MVDARLNGGRAEVAKEYRQQRHPRRRSARMRSGQHGGSQGGRWTRNRLARVPLRLPGASLARGRQTATSGTVAGRTPRSARAARSERSRARCSRLRRAAQTSGYRRWPCPQLPRMRLAHIVLAHTLPEQLVRLVGRLHDPNDLVLIHVDRRQSLRPFTTALGGLLERPEVRLLPRVRCRWGGFGLVQAALNGIEAALAADARPDYVCLLSGQDYPIKTRSRMVDVLTRADGHVFLRHFPLPRKGYVDDGGMARLERWYLRPSRRWSLPNRFVPFFPKRRVPGGLRPYGGTQFWLMPGEVAASVISYVAANPGLARFFRHSL